MTIIFRQSGTWTWQTPQGHKMFLTVYAGQEQKVANVVYDSNPEKPAQVVDYEGWILSIPADAISVIR